MSAFELPRRAKVGAMAAEIRRLERENAALREALEKFIAYDSGVNDDGSAVEMMMAYAEVVRAASAALAEPLEGETPDLIGGGNE